MYSVLDISLQASHRGLQEVWPIPSDWSTVTESCLMADSLTQTFSALPKCFHQ